MAWRSSKADFRWVWWDPGQKELKKYKERRRFLRWVPKCFRSYEFTTADAIWNPGPSVGRCLAPGENTAGRSCTERRSLSTQNLCMAVLKSSERRDFHNVSSSQMSMSDRSQLSLIASRQLDRRLEGNSTTDTIQLRDLRILYNHAGMPLPLNHSIYVRKGNRMVLLFPKRNIAMRQNLSMPCLLSTEPGRSRLVDRSEGFYTGQNFGHGEVGSRSIQKRPRALAYQMWSARMELQTSKCIRYNQSPLLGPPGSPESGLIGSFSSEHAASLDLVPRTFGRSIANPSSDATSHAVSMKQHVDHDRGDMSDESAQDSEAEHRRCKPQLRIDNSSRRSAEARDSGLQAASPGAVQNSPRSDRAKRPRSLDETNKSKKLRKKHQTKARHLAHGKEPLRSLSTWEARLAHDLNRKLEWLFEQLSPGQRLGLYSILFHGSPFKQDVFGEIHDLILHIQYLAGGRDPNIPGALAKQPTDLIWIPGGLLSIAIDGRQDFKTSSRASRYLQIPQMNHGMGKSIQQAGFFEGPRKALQCQPRSKTSTTKEEQVGKRPSVTGKGMKEIAVGLTRYFQAITNEPLNTPKTAAA
ncbi:hypothetical protein GB937_009979 [Aspergillus fischeri]|nr:hypothetical protein GB937_009979 [Aspergillus fischeri]